MSLSRSSAKVRNYSALSCDLSRRRESASSRKIQGELSTFLRASDALDFYEV